MENHPCYKVFTGINLLNARLEVLGLEGIKVLENMVNEGMSSDILEPFFEVARKAAGLEDKVSKVIEVKEKKRCKWWNRGFCREREKCSFLHDREECQEHLSGGCTSKGCHTLRHRKQCRYFSSEKGCHRGDTCEYLHIEENHSRERNNAEVESEEKNLVKSKEVQTEKEVTCVCRDMCTSYKVQFKEDKVICILKRAKCSDQEWREYEEKVESEMGMEDLLEDLGKVLEAAHRLTVKAS